MRPTLIVVDMQATFTSAKNINTVIAVAAEITKARESNCPIIFLEYEGCGQIHRGFLELLRNYPYKAVVRKCTDDGSEEVVRTIKRRKFEDRHLRICGVNTDACVWATCRGLLKKTNCTLEVVRNACNTDLGPSCRKYDWRRFFRHPQLRLV